MWIFILFRFNIQIFQSFFKKRIYIRCFQLVTPEGTVKHINWANEYKKLRSAVGIEWPGYMIHESVQWSEIYRKWFFLPRRASKLAYTEAEDEEKG